MQKGDNVLCLGNMCWDNTKGTNRLPMPGEKTTATYSLKRLGAGATNAAICCAKLGLVPHLHVPVGVDEFGEMAERRLAKHNIQLIRRDADTTPINDVYPLMGDRAILRDVPVNYLQPNEFKKLEPDDYAVLLLDGHQADAARYHAETFGNAGRLVLLDCNDRPNTDELLGLTGVAVAGESYMKACGYEEPDALLDYFRRKGCRVGGVTLGEHGVRWYADDGEPVSTPALEVPGWRSKNTNGLGDAFHGALAYACAQWPDQTWEYRMLFASYYSGLMLKLSDRDRVYPTVENVLALLNSRPQLVRAAG